jgi:hypothetical protein
MPISDVLQSIVDFVRQGYPEGVPQHDYIPLFALLRRRLSEDEVATIAGELADFADDPGTTTAIVRAAIEVYTKDEALPGDVGRVKERLAAAGYQLDEADGSP